MFESEIIIDGRGHLMGRLASIVAKQILCGQRIVVVRCEEIDISGASTYTLFLRTFFIIFLRFFDSFLNFLDYFEDDF